MKKLLFIALACAGVVSAVSAQTGRIAHFSHSGSVSRSVAVEDNFGTPPSYFAVDSVRYASATTLVAYGQWRWAHNPEKERTIQLPEKMSAAAAMRYLHQHHELVRRDGRSSPVLKYLNFDSTGRAGQLLPSRRNRKKNKAAAGSRYPLPPGNLGGPALLLAALAGAGWLLAGRRQKTSFAA